MSLITIDELEKNTGVPYSATQDIGFLTNLIMSSVSKYKPTVERHS